MGNAATSNSSSAALTWSASTFTKITDRLRAISTIAGATVASRLPNLLVVAVLAYLTTFLPDPSQPKPLSVKEK